MARLFPISKEQQDGIVDIVEKDASFFSDGLGGEAGRLAVSTELMVHGDVVGPLPQSLDHGLPQSPRQISSNEGVAFLSGAREIGMEVATCLAAILAMDSNKVLYLPHAYARPTEIDSLQEDFGGLVLEVAGRVYIKGTGPGVQPELLRRALASMICGYSVGWLLDTDLPESMPSSAVVPVFDGEGWAVAGKSILQSIKKH